jgi:hypothetical protein
LAIQACKSAIVDALDTYLPTDKYRQIRIKYRPRKSMSIS